MKKCSRCKRSKKVTNFSLDRTRKDGRASYCKRCYAIQVRGQRARTHSVDPDSLPRLIEAQGGVCACCKQQPVSLEPSPKFERRSFVDYRRGWGVAAGIVCAFCMPCLNTVKNNRTSVHYLNETQGVSA